MGELITHIFPKFYTGHIKRKEFEDLLVESINTKYPNCFIKNIIYTEKGLEIKLDWGTIDVEIDWDEIILED